jgi:hypothetical protein
MVNRKVIELLKFRVGYPLKILHRAGVRSSWRSSRHANKNVRDAVSPPRRLAHHYGALLCVREPATDDYVGARGNNRQQATIVCNVSPPIK